MRSGQSRSVLDAVDRAIIDLLKNNARTSIREIARAIKKSPSVIHSRIKRLEMSGIIRGYTALLDYQKLGYGIFALTLLQVDGGHITEVETVLAREPNVRAVYDITGEYDVALLTVFSSVEELDAFIKKILKLPYIKRSVTNLILRVVKEEPHIGTAFTIKQLGSH